MTPQIMAGLRASTVARLQCRTLLRTDAGVTVRRLATFTAAVVHAGLMQESGPVVWRSSDRQGVCGDSFD